MTPLLCAEHPDSPAGHRCDGCARPLCEECIEEGHRLLFCRLCGERALPVVEEGPASTPELARERVRAMPLDWREALRFPLRGQGRFVGVGAVLYLALLQGMLLVAPFMGLGAIPFGLLYLFLSAIFLLLAVGLSFGIVRATAKGAAEMPDWPDFSDFGERMSELFASIVLGFMALLPAIVLIRLTDCEIGLIAADLSCLGVMIVGLALGLPLWIPAFGAVGVFGNPWLSIRWDLHARALVRIWPPTLRIATALVALYFGGALVGLILGVIPLLGGLATLVVDVYTWLLGMHLIGLLMRQHEGDLEPIYFK